MWKLGDADAMAETSQPPELVSVNVTLTESQYSKIAFPSNTSSISYEDLEAVLSKSIVAPSSEKVHELDSAGLLAFSALLLLSVVTIWGFKYRRSRYIHESGLCIIYGAVIGIIVRYDCDLFDLYPDSWPVLRILDM